MLLGLWQTSFDALRKQKLDNSVDSVYIGFPDLLSKLFEVSHLIVVVGRAKEHLEDKLGPDDAVNRFFGFPSNCADCKDLLSLFHGFTTVAGSDVGIYKLNLTQISTCSSVCHWDAQNNTQLIDVGSAFRYEVPGLEVVKC